MHTYYRSRATYYDRVYSIPECQHDLVLLNQKVTETFVGRDVLELACGTGYWSQTIAPSATRLTATDTSPEVIEIAKSREGCAGVKFSIQNAYSLAPELNKFDGLFCGLWVSHVPREKLRTFLVETHQHLNKGAVVLFVDNSEQQCVELPIVHTDESGNTYQDRVLDNGDVHRIIKNFPSREALEKSIVGIGEDSGYELLEHYWWFSYRVS